MRIVQRLLLKLGAMIHAAESAAVLSTVRACGESVRIDRRVFLWGTAELEIGSNVDINGYTVIYASGGVRIHDNVLIAANCVISSVSHPNDPDGRHQVISAPVELLENCWLGAGTVVVPGVTIGKNSIVAAGSVVTSNVPDNCIYAGVPAKLLRHL